MDVLEAQAPDHAQFVLCGLNKSRHCDPKLCDFSISVDGCSFPCHRSVLCLFSSFFEAAVKGGFKENSDNCVQLQDVCKDDVAAILDYVYTGKLMMNHSNVEGLLNAATRLGFRKVVTMCLDYIRHQIDQTNCLDILKLAKEQKYDSLETSARQYLYDHLCSVFECEVPENEIELKDVEEMLRDVQTHKQGEECIVLAIMTWIQSDIEHRKAHANNLLNHVHWRRLPAPFLLKVLLRHPLLSADSFVKQVVLDHVRRSYDDGKSELMTSFYEAENRGVIADTNPDLQQNRQEPTSPILLSPSYRNHRPRIAPHQALLLIGGLSLGEAERGDTSQPNVMCYHPVERVWRPRSAWPERGLRGFSVTKFNNNVVVTGGCATTVSKHIVIKRAWIYDVERDDWCQLVDMIKSRAFHSSCQLNSQLFVVGGTVGSTVDVEFYDQHKSAWTSLQNPVPRMMYNFTASGCNSKLILIGSGQSSTIFLQCYNPAVDSWTVLRSPNVPRHLSAPVCVNSNDESKIFVSGDNTKKLYIFDPNVNSWSRAADMNNLHSNGNLILLGGEVFHTGGHWEEDGYWDEMESYNESKNVWTPQGALPHLWLYHGCATIFLDD